MSHPMDTLPIKYINYHLQISSASHVTLVLININKLTFILKRSINTNLKKTSIETNYKCKTNAIKQRNTCR